MHVRESAIAIRGQIQSQPQRTKHTVRTSLHIQHTRRADIEARPLTGILLAVARQDIDHTEKGIRTIGHWIRAPHDFHTINLVQSQRQGGPIDTTERRRRVDRAAIHQHLHFRRICSTQAMIGDPVGAATFLPGLHSWHQTQHPRQITIARRTDEIAIQHCYSTWRLIERLRQARNR